MKFVCSVILFFSFSYVLLAQVNTSCDGKRYLTEVFGKVKTTTVTYGKNVPVFGTDTINLNMDIYEPEGDVVPIRPAIVLAFGGAFVSGDRTQLSTLAQEFARHGYVAACIDYRIWPVFILGFPDSASIVNVSMKAMSDMKASIRYLKSESSKYRIDTSLVFAGGVSAGAITAIQIGYLDQKDSIPAFLKEVMDKNGGFTGNSNTTNLKHTTTLAGVLNLSGGIFRTEWINSGEPPMVSIHGTADVTVPYAKGKAAGLVTLNGSGNIHIALKQQKIREHLVTVPGGGHTDIYFEAPFKPYVDSINALSKRVFHDIICNKLVSSANDKSKITLANIYPNPATYFTNIETDQKIQTVKMYDMVGRNIAVHLSQNRVDWSDRLTPGIYTLEILLADKTRLFSKIMIQ